MGLLNVRNISKKFGGLYAVRDCSFSIDKGQIVGLIGPNGSGKTTLFNMISGIVKPTAGEVYFRNQRITGSALYDIAQNGISRTFQITRVFKNMTVVENLLAVAPKERNNNDEIDRILTFVNLRKLSYEYAGNLSYGQQKLLELARALITDPDLLLLDEPVSGIYPAMIEEIVGHIQRARELGKTIFLIEHNMGVVMRLCDRVIVLNHGEKIAEGNPGEVQSNPQVMESYLGKRK